MLYSVREEGEHCFYPEARGRGTFHRAWACIAIVINSRYCKCVPRVGMHNLRSKQKANSSYTKLKFDFSCTPYDVSYLLFLHRCSRGLLRAFILVVFFADIKFLRY